MQITHVALWTQNLVATTKFSKTYFDCSIGEEYASLNRKGFKSRFVKFQNGPTIEMMTGPWLKRENTTDIERVGWAHIAISLGSEESVRELATRFDQDGLLVSQPRFTGDGFYEAVAKSPDDILVEITS